MPTDASLNKLLTEALEKLEAAKSEILELRRGDSKEFYQIVKFGRAIGLIREFQEPIFEKNPELRPPPPADYVPDPDMSEEEIEMTSRLPAEELEKIDEAIFAELSNRYLKVARIVGRAADTYGSSPENVPYVFYVQRIRKLVEKGILESQGDLSCMRFSEVRKVKK